MAVVVGVEMGLLLPGPWNWARAGGIQQLSEWPSIRHSWVQVSEASAKAFCRFTSMAVKKQTKKEGKKQNKVKTTGQNTQRTGKQQFYCGDVKGLNELMNHNANKRKLSTYQWLTHKMSAF